MSARSERDLGADALLVRPDGYTAWVAAADAPADGQAEALRESLVRWFGPAGQDA